MNLVSKVEIFEKTKEEKLASVLESFNIKAKSITLMEGSYVDSYDIKLLAGSRASKLDRVLVDIGMALSSHCHPVGYPVMKNGSYRIELQTKEIASPSFSEVRSAMSEENLFLPIAIGVGASGEMFFRDLNRIPNLLVGGTTGSGKSVLLHSFILSLIAGDADIFLVDPKMVEFGVYEDLHQVKSIVNSADEAEGVIETLISLMERRFSILKKAKSRNIIEYNLSTRGGDRLSPVALVIDEWADLVLQNKSIQKSLCLLAQKGRAAGISIILATQRPSANVVSGLIKANFPGRIALRTSSAVDSRVILDASGAEKIEDIGMGLYIDGVTSKPTQFRAANIVDISGELDNLGPRMRGSLPFWRRIFN